MEEQTLIDDLYNEVKTMIGKRSVNSKNIVVIVSSVIFIVEETKLSGTVKKDLVIELVTKLVNELPLGDEKDQVMIFVKSMLPATIDTIIEAANGKLLSKCCLIV